LRSRKSTGLFMRTTPLASCVRPTTGPAKLDRSLPVRLPTSAVESMTKRPRKKRSNSKTIANGSRRGGTIQSAVHRAYHLTGLLCGARPGEMKPREVDRLEAIQRCRVIGNAKARQTQSAFRSRGQWLERSRSRRDEARASGSTRNLSSRRPRKPCVMICRATGNSVRHAFKTLCSLDLKVDDTISSLLMGHALDGVSKKYISKIIITSGPALRSEQARISRRVVQLLGLTSAELMARACKAAVAGSAAASGKTD